MLVVLLLAGAVTVPSGALSPAPYWDADHLRPAPDLAYRLHGELGPTAHARFAPPPATQHSMPSCGTVRTVAILVDFPDAPAPPGDGRGDVARKVFGSGDPALAPYESVRSYYLRSSGDRLALEGEAVGWFHSNRTRAFYRERAAQYQATYGAAYGPTIGQVCARSDLLREALAGVDGQVDFSRCDADGNGVVDAVYLVYAGPPDDGRDLFWSWQDVYLWHYWDVDSARYDGLRVGPYVFTPYAGAGASAFDPGTAIHETGHLLGLPDYYDYATGVGPRGGLGGWDMMDTGVGDHNAFSKYLLGWVEPVVVPAGGRRVDLAPASGGAVLVMPGAAPDAYGEFFMVECRKGGTGNDPALVFDEVAQALRPFGPSLAVWHVDASLDPLGRQFACDNSYTTHKLLRLMEADGAEHLERGTAPFGANNHVEDLYGPGDALGPGTVPDSAAYDGRATNVTVGSIVVGGAGVRAWVGVEPEPVLPVPGAAGAPRDLDGDGRYEDVNGNGRLDFADLVLFFERLGWIGANEPVAAFDYGGNDRLDFSDAVSLFARL